MSKKILLLNKNEKHIKFSRYDALFEDKWQIDCFNTRLLFSKNFITGVASTSYDVFFIFIYFTFIQWYCGKSQSVYWNIAFHNFKYALAAGKNISNLYVRDTRIVIES